MLQLKSSAPAPPEPEFVLRGHDHAVTALQFLRRLDGPTVLASGDVRGIVRVWDLEQRRPLSTWAAHEDAGILELHELADGEQLLSQSRDGRIRLWDTSRFSDKMSPVRTLVTDAYHFCKCAVAQPLMPVSADADRPREDDEEARVAAEEERPVVLPPPEKKEGSSLGDLLSSSFDDADSVVEEDAGDVGCSSGYFREATIARHLVLAPSEPPESMTIWDTRCDTYAHRLAPADSERKSLGVALSARLWLPSHASSDTDTPPLAVVGYESGHILMWDLRKMRPRLYGRSSLFESPLMGVDLDAEATLLYAGGVEAALRVSKLQRGTLVPYGALPRATCAGEHTKDGMGELALRPDGKIFATAGWDKRLRVFSAKPPKFKQLAILRFHDDSINALSFSRNSTLLASGSKDTKIAIWKIFQPTPNTTHSNDDRGSTQGR